MFRLLVVGQIPARYVVQGIHAIALGLAHHAGSPAPAVLNDSFCTQQIYFGKRFADDTTSNITMQFGAKPLLRRCRSS